MLSGFRIFGYVKTSQGGHALTNKLLVKFFQISPTGQYKALITRKKLTNYRNTKKVSFSQHIKTKFYLIKIF